MPNGAGNFDVVTITQDISYPSLSHSNADRMVFVNISANTLNGYDDDWVFSGSTAPSPDGTSYAWYDTTNNLVKYTSDSGATWTTGLSLPICIGNYVKDTGFTSIDNVFNGFGYVGSTVFALPGIKGLIPNGRNTDGTLKNIEYVNDSVKTTTTNYTLSNGLVALNPIGVHEISTVLWNYNQEKNIFENSSGQISPHFVVASASYNNGIVSNFQPKTLFHSVDYNEVKNVVFPSQAGNAGKALLTDGENVYWGDTSGVIIRDWSL